MNTKKEIKQLLSNPYQKHFIALFLAGFVTFGCWCVERTEHWNVFFLFWALFQLLSDIITNDMDGQIRKDEILKCLIRNTDLMTNELAQNPLFLPITIKVLSDCELLLYDLCDCCDQECATINQRSKEIITEHKKLFQKHRINPINTVTVDIMGAFVDDINMVKTILLNS